MTNRNNNFIFFIGLLIILLIAVSVFIHPSKKEQPTDDNQIKNKPYNDFSYIIPKELRSKITDNKPITLLDIRDAVNFRKVHLENSINIPYNNYSQKEIERLPRDRLTVVIGYSYDDKKQLGEVMKTLKDLGFKKVVALSGGIKAWQENNNPTINEGDPQSVLDTSKIEYILPEQLKLALDNKYPLFILDVRPALLYDQGHLPGAVNIPLNQLEQRKNELPVSKEIVVYGQNQMEDFKAGVKLYDLGFMANYIIKGGLADWKRKGFDLTN